MKTVFAIICLSLFTFAMPRESAGQDIAIVNARILDGKGGVIERGSVVVRGGKILSVAAGAPASTSETRIDAQGLTLMPSFIDAYRHIAQGNPAEWLAKAGAAQMQEFLDAGFTTGMCAISPVQAIGLRHRIDSGAVNGLDVSKILGRGDARAALKQNQIGTFERAGSQTWY